MKKSSLASGLASRAASIASNFMDEAEPAPVRDDAAPKAIPAAAESEEAARRTGGRPKGKRAVAARQTVYLDEARHAALARLADDRGRSIHSLILEGIDRVIDKPAATGWQ
ncbi:hypothetical protein [Methylobacterium gnaphalii]|uniref:Uncharacterized protein n=1 Tax=Methylobacterium gnaphalii TaxID=1010610 RepID=A0A512JRF5_9HYPH|nr:hypothetical protein [Methylobacterium gnaphalii]GEP12534.1 hypothetical protein MGN01_43790 [Methylobacterium gnaphalii]GJD70193.1 hypothetical protein MMMDOFMJ_3135 [Methylobacterium gnaphalii]GLS51504.1 hypothetical protein GCM10007885_43620 [Methylobacterium gnaphalii]